MKYQVIAIIQMKTTQLLRLHASLPIFVTEYQLMSRPSGIRHGELHALGALSHHAVF